MAARWGGLFGDEYTDRNQPSAEKRAEFFKIFASYDVKSAFEVGCNVGTNLEAMALATGAEVYGCDINNKALGIADAAGFEVYWEDATDLDHMCAEYDLVFTVGVLIHLNSPAMIKCMKEMHRVSGGLVMFAEYEGDDIEMPYRGNRGALIKRDYGGIYSALFPEAVLLERGFLPREMGFDDVTYWVFYDSGDSTSSYELDPVARESNERSDGQIVAASLAGTIGAVRADRLNYCGHGAGIGK